MVAITRHMSHALLAIAMFSRLSMVTGGISSSVIHAHQAMRMRHSIARRATARSSMLCAQ
jgi:hypothetical protein